MKLCARGCFLRRLGLLGELRKRGRAGDGEFRQALAVERDAGVFQPADEPAVREAMLSGSRVDADDPQSPEVPLLTTASDERVLERRVDRLFRGAIEFALVGVITFGQAQQLLALGAANRSSFYTRHLKLLTSFLVDSHLYGSILASFGVSTAATTVVPRSARLRLVVLLFRMCCLNALLRKNFPLLVRLKRLAAPRCVFSFGIVFYPCGAQRRPP